MAAQVWCLHGVGSATSSSGAGAAHHAPSSLLNGTACQALGARRHNPRRILETRERAELLRGKNMGKKETRYRRCGGGAGWGGGQCWWRVKTFIKKNVNKLYKTKKFHHVLRRSMLFWFSVFQSSKLLACYNTILCKATYFFAPYLKWMWTFVFMNKSRDFFYIFLDGRLFNFYPVVISLVGTFLCRRLLCNDHL